MYDHPLHSRREHNNSYYARNRSLPPKPALIMFLGIVYVTLITLAITGMIQHLNADAAKPSEEQYYSQTK
jgi:hypothetical protein